MAESFYHLLGVEPDADEDAVRAAYREQVKEHHPDVSDDPGAARRFRQLTTARDVLLDPDERERYDRLGHATYVDRFVDTAANSGTDRGAGPGAGDRSGQRGARGGSRSSSGDRHRDGSPGRGPADRTRDRGRWDAGTGARGTARSAGGGPVGETWLGEDGDGPTSSGSADHRRRGRRRHVRDSPGERTVSDPGVDEPWQRASAAYRRSEAASVAAAEQGSEDLVDLLAAVGPWVIVHVVLLASAIATVVFLITQTGGSVNLSLPAYVVGVGLLGGVAMLLVLHVVSQVYT